MLSQGVASLLRHYCYPDATLGEHFMSLTELGINKLKAPRAGKRREKYDRQIPGFGIRVTDRGVRSYILVYTHGGRRRRYTIGRVSEIGLEDARELARQLRGQVRREGRDPAAEQKTARA